MDNQGFYSIVSKEIEEYPIYFSFYSDLNERRERGYRYNLTHYFTRLYAHVENLDRHISHVDILLNGKGYGPKQSSYIVGVNHHFGHNERNIVKLYVDKEDYKRMLKFTRGEERARIGFDYCGFLNFFPFCPCYCIPINFGSEYLGPFRRWFCSNFAATALKKLNKIKSMKPSAFKGKGKDFLLGRTCTIIPEDLYSALLDFGAIINSDISYTNKEIDLMNKAEIELDKEIGY